MIHHITLTGRSIALACNGTVTTQHGADGATSAVYVEAPHLTLLHDVRDGEFYRTGQNSWSLSGWRRLNEAPTRIADEQRRRTADDAPWDDPARHHSAWMAVLEDSTGTLLVGCLDGRIPRLRVDTAVLKIFTESGGPARWVILPGPATAIMARYACELGESLGGRAIEPQSVWCSWYSYYEGISQEALEWGIPQVAELGFKTPQIDDGQKVTAGGWEAGESFGGGMEAVATRIREAGMQPGLWAASFIALPGLRVVRNYPGMFVRNADGGLAVAGSNWGGDYYVLDTIHPAAQTYVRKLIAKVVRRRGFSYLKLDFINAAAIPGYRHRQTDREKAYRTGLRLVRDTTREETFLLGSGALIIPPIGLLDTVQVESDTAPMWESYAFDGLSDAKAYNALHVGVNRLWLGRVIGVDPDVVFFRHRRNLLDNTQMQWLRDVAEASRYRCLSDQTTWLDEEEKEAVRASLAAEDESLEILGRYHFSLDEREVDLTEAIEGAPPAYPL